MSKGFFMSKTKNIKKLLRIGLLVDNSDKKLTNEEVIDMAKPVFSDFVKKNNGEIISIETVKGDIFDELEGLVSVRCFYDVQKI